MDDNVKQAVESFWVRRESQAERQRQSGRVDAGRRGAVTGGGHLDAIRDVIADVFVSNGIDRSAIRINRGVVLPGYYRPTKKWDLVVMDDDVLVAAIELKSQVGPSFGNNFNNRSEEAIGNAVDVWRAYEEGTFGDVRPWLGYAFVLEDDPGSTSPVRLEEATHETERVFDGSSYMDRYGILCERLVKERLYDAAWFVATSSRGTVREPKPSLSYRKFAAAIAGRVAYIRNL
jgi:type II restriction enzyme